MAETAGAAQDKPVAKRQMRNFLLDRRFQLSWVFRAAIATTIVVAVMGYFLYGTLADASDQLLVDKLADPALTQEATEAFIAQNDKDKTLTLWTLVGGLVVLVVLLSAVTIILTHKIAGPAYKMKKLFASVDGNHLQLWAKLRKGDELHDVFEEFDRMLRRIREHRHQDVEELEAIRSALEDVEAAQGARGRIEELIVRFRDSVKME